MLRVLQASSVYSQDCPVLWIEAWKSDLAALSESSLFKAYTRASEELVIDKTIN